MKNTLNLGVLVLVVGLMVSGCSNVFHNGTQMSIATVKVTGLPTNPYTPGQVMIFSYNVNGTGNWVHDNKASKPFTDAYWQAPVAADGSWTLTFSPPLEVLSGQVQFLLIDPGKNWNNLKVDHKISGKSGGDVYLDSTWAPNSTITGTVSGDSVSWTIQ